MNVSTGVLGVLDLGFSSQGVVVLLWNASEGGDGNDMESLEGVAAGISACLSLCDAMRPPGGDRGDTGDLGERASPADCVGEVKMSLEECTETIVDAEVDDGGGE